MFSLNESQFRFTYFQKKTNFVQFLQNNLIIVYFRQHIDEHLPVDGKHVLVIGSQSPWIETILLNKGAKNITTFDYVKIRSEHPQVEVLTPEELSDKFLNKKIRYDVIISFSSVEHSGLGRFSKSYFFLFCLNGFLNFFY